MVPGLLPASACLELSLSLCRGKLGLGLTVLSAQPWGLGGKRRLGLCCLGLGGEGSSLLSYLHKGLSSGCPEGAESTGV